jgi:sulfur carrier protein
VIAITVNGERQPLEPGATLADLLRNREGNHRVAAAVNGDFVPRSRHAEYLLKDGDVVEIVAPMQGG